MFSEVENISPALQEKLVEALETIRPYLKADGGDIKVLNLTNNMTLQIELLGTCKSCSMSAMTLKAGVEQAILKAVPQIKAIEAIDNE